LRIVLWGKHSLAVQRKRRMRKAERRIFRDLRRRSSIVLINAMVSGPPTHVVVLCVVVYELPTVLGELLPHHPTRIFPA
jgi:hypothetical protein